MSRRRSQSAAPGLPPSFEVFNLFNTHDEVDEDVTTGPIFRVPTAIQPPRAARIGLRVAF